MLKFAAITPHPPLLVPEIGSQDDLGRISKTVKAMRRLGKEIEKEKIETILIISPHAPLDYNSFAINFSPELEGSLSQFGLDDLVSFKNDLELSEQIYKRAEDKSIPVSRIKEPLDHGSLVPLSYLTQKLECELVVLSFSLLGLDSHLEYGKLIGEIVAKNSKKIAVVASGDLSHRLTPDAPAGYSPKGKEFDELLIEKLRQDDVSGILSLEEDLIEEAGECGLRSIVILLGILSSKKYCFNLLSYEGPFGVGYLVARLI